MSRPNNLTFHKFKTENTQIVRQPIYKLRFNALPLDCMQVMCIIFSFHTYLGITSLYLLLAVIQSIYAYRGTTWAPFPYQIQ